MSTTDTHHRHDDASTITRSRTDMTNAILTGADLRGVDLRRVRGLTRHQLRSARIDSSTRLPVRLRILRMLEALAKPFGGHRSTNADSVHGHKHGWSEGHCENR
jgi:uncharacterized protein YjbI with pentapeptide repeats